ncbi:hypothetical protein IH879_06210 [candidate division KSB1 bacterium]|nr:hypothetical protein [candidate division KSB1 bacterium]
MGLEIIFSITNLRSLLTSVLLALAFTVNILPVLAQESEVEKKTKPETEKAAKEENTKKWGDEKKHGGKHGSRLTDEYIPLQLEGFPERPRPILEIGQNFLGTGTLAQGIKLPTGAVWQPYFMLFGTLRSGLQSFNDGEDQFSEWANRFDLFGNLYLTFTERILVGFRPLDKDGRFTGALLQGPAGIDKDFREEFNLELTSLFFEGDFGEIFPNLDKEDGHGFDYGFSVGRQPISFQEGMLINDNIDAIGLTKTNWKFPSSAVNFRWTTLYGWNELNRRNLPDDNGWLLGLLTETDFRPSTVAVDIIYVNGNDFTGNGIYAGVSAVQRMGKYNTSFRVLSSFPLGDETAHNSQGTLLFSEISWTPHGTHNLVYINGFLGIKNFRSASRGPATGGPLGRTGILFESSGLGQFGGGTTLRNTADEVVGGALGYQMFFAHTRQQLILELGGRYADNSFDQRAIAGGARYQMALGRRFVIVLDGAALYEFEPANDVRFGGRFELLLRL